MFTEKLALVSNKVYAAASTCVNGVDSNTGQTCSNTSGGIGSIPTPKIKEVILTPESLILKLINYSLFFIGAAALVFVIYGAILFITSGGDSDKTTKARQTLLYAVIGIVVVALSWAIINWAAGAFTNTVTGP